MTREEQDFEYLQYLQAKHSAVQTPPDIVRDLITKATKAPVTAIERLVVGEANEVYAVTTDGGDLIVRISRQDDPRFYAEKVAMDKVRAAGLITPEVLHIEKRDIGSETIWVCIEKRLPGVPMLNALIKGVSEKELLQLAAQVGAVFGKIHGVKIQGWGYLDENGDGQAPQGSWANIMLDVLKHRKNMHHISDEVGIPINQIDQALDLIEAHSSLYIDSEPRLVHGDLGPDHILINNGQVSGVIDFQRCSGSSPILDFAWWDFFWGNKIPLSIIIPAYPHKELLTTDFDSCLELGKLHMAIWMAQHYRNEKHEIGLKIVRDNLKRSLEYFEK